MDRNSKLNKTFLVSRQSPLLKNDGKTRMSSSSPTLQRPASPTSRNSNSGGKKSVNTKLPVTSRERIVPRSLSLNNNKDKTPERVIPVDKTKSSVVVTNRKAISDSSTSTSAPKVSSDVVNSKAEPVVEVRDSPENIVTPSPPPSVTVTPEAPVFVDQDQEGSHKKRRKTWNLCKRTDLTRLIIMENMAQEGCDVSQFQLAKDLLDDKETSTRSQKNENDRKAVFWLIKSAEQGNVEARKLLQDCLSTGRGITWQNISDIKDCISTSLGHKLVVRAANRLFDKLNNGEDFITTTQIHLHANSSKEDLNRTYDVVENGSTTTTPIREEDPPDLVSGNFTMIHRNSDSSTKPLEESDDEDPDDNSMTDFSLDPGRQLTRAKLLEIAKAYNKGSLPEVRLNPGYETTRFMDLGTASFGATVIGLFLLLEVTLKAMTVKTALLIVSTLVVILCSYCFLVWKRRRELFNEWTRAFVAALPKLNETDLEDCFNICKTQLMPFYGLNLASLALLHALHAPRLVVGVASTLSVYAIFQGVLRSGSRWRLMAAAALTYAMKCIFISESLAIGYTEDTLDLAVITTSLMVLMEGVLHSKRIIDAEVMGSVVAYAWIWKLLSSSAFLQLETIAVSIISFYCIVAMYQIMKKFVNPIWLVLRLILLGMVLLAVVTTAAFLTEKNSYVNVNDGSTTVQRVPWDEYNLNCNRLAWKSSSVAETILNCTVKYERIPTFVTWDGKVDGVKISTLEYSPSGSLSATFEILIVIDPPLEPEVRSGWDILPGSAKKEKEFRSVVSLIINTDDIVGGEKKKEAITRLVSFKPGDKVEFHGVLKKGAGSLKPEIGDVQMIRCLKCARNDYLGHSYTSNSVSASLLKPYKTYLGSDMFELLSELEAEYRYLLEYFVKELRQKYSS